MRRPEEDLFHYLMHYTFAREVDEQERTTLFCQMVSLYENRLRISEAFGLYHQYEYAKVYPPTRNPFIPIHLTYGTEHTYT